MQSAFAEFTLSEPVSPPVHTCVVCSTPSMLSCAYCVSGPAYCSTEHFRQHWGAHASVCDGSRSPASMRNSASVSLSAMFAGGARTPALLRRPTVVTVQESQVVGYLLGADAPAPEFTQITCHTAYLNGRYPATVPDVWPYFEQGYGFLVQHYDRFKYPLPQPLHYLYCAASYRAQANFNRAVKALLKQHEDGPLIRWTNWPGTIVVLKFMNASCNAYADLTEEDLDNVRAFFQML